MVAMHKGTSRHGSVGVGRFEYTLSNGYVATRMGNNDFYIFREDGLDTGFDFPTLRECRSWADRKGREEARMRNEALAKRLSANSPW